MKVATTDALALYRWMLLTRRFEEKVVDLNKQRSVTELPHSCIGQEAVGVGVCYGLRREDCVLPSLRTRAAFLMRGFSCRTLMAAMFGKDTREAGGKITSHHMGDPALGVLPCSGVLAAHIPVALGPALASKYRGTGGISVVFFGDGSSNRGDFHEGLNLAASLELPVLFVIENNQYASSTPIRSSFKGERLSDRAISYGFPGVQVDGNDVIAVHQAATEAIDRARTGHMPTLLECITYRWRGHAERDAETPYRPAEEVELWKTRCPIRKLEGQLLESGVSQQELDLIDESCRAEVDDSVAFADAAPYPPAESALTGVYAQSPLTL